MKAHEKIIGKFPKEIMNGDWGIILNKIQDVAREILSEKEWNTVMTKVTRDIRASEYSDGVMFNGCYFDWKEFTPRCAEIVLAYLGYFSDEQVNEIAEKI